jgi:hypothetical protein
MVAQVLLLYGGGAGPPRLRRHGCTVLVGTAARGRARHDLEGGPPPMRNTGDVLHPWQAAAYTRDRSTTVTSDLGLTSLDLGSQIFLLLKIDLWCRLT